MMCPQAKNWQSQQKLEVGGGMYSPLEPLGVGRWLAVHPAFGPVKLTDWARTQWLWYMGLVARGMWNPPKPGIKPMSPALAGRCPSTAAPGKSSFCLCLLRTFVIAFRTHSGMQSDLVTSRSLITSAKNFLSK